MATRISRRTNQSVRRGRFARGHRPGRHLARAVGLSAFTVLFSTGAAADDLVRADPWRIIHIARELGPAEVRRDGMRDPQIRGTLDGLHYRLDFYGCYLGRDCDTILFDARFTRREWAQNPPKADIIAEWNREKLVGRARLDADGRAVLDWAVALDDGVPEGTLRAAFRRWGRAMVEFAGHFGHR